MSDNKKTAKLRGDKPSASSPTGYADLKELSSIAFARTRMPMVMADARLPDQPIVLANASFLDLTGYGADEVIGRNCRFLQGPETSPDAVAQIRSALQKQQDADIEILNYRKNGEPFWNRLHLSAINDEEGQLLYFFASQIDITEQRRIEALEATEHRLLKEVDHRAKNVMAIVESIVRLSNSENSALYAAAIQHRVQALARVHSMLAEHGWRDVELGEVIRQQIAPFAQNRVTFDGQSVKIPPLAVQPLGLAIHELAANAARHGSLASDDGRLHIDWSHSDDRQVTLNWTENGTKPGARQDVTGFGTVLMNAMVESQLGGSITRSWRSQGLSVQMSMSL
jgi:PAS domain S-box-containing protein